MTLAASAYIGGTKYTASPAGSSHTLSPTIHASQSHRTGVTVGVGVLSHVQSPPPSKLFFPTPRPSPPQYARRPPPQPPAPAFGRPPPAPLPRHHTKAHRTDRTSTRSPPL